ncbi:hypothetical protein [Rheinheimera salexigens]|nr:hypothetical protein [Rheinheimera salexigens]
MAGKILVVGSSLQVESAASLLLSTDPKAEKYLVDKIKPELLLLMRLVTT